MSLERRQYSKEFKINAVKLITEQGQRITQTARELGIHENMLYKWREQYGKESEEAFRGNGKLTTRDDYIRKLEQENKRLRDERDILKKAAIFFARDT